MEVLIQVRGSLGRHIYLAYDGTEGRNSDRNGLHALELDRVHPGLEDCLEGVDVIDRAGFCFQDSGLENPPFGGVQEGDFQGSIAYFNSHKNLRITHILNDL